MVGQGIFLGIQQFIPDVLWGGFFEWGSDKFVPGIRGSSSACPDTAGEHAEELETSGHLPAPLVARGSAAPDVCGERRASSGNVTRHLHDQRRGDTALMLGIGRRIGGVMGFEGLYEVSKGALGV